MHNFKTLILSLILVSSSAHAQFTEVAASVNLDFGGSKDGGVAWADFNEDGFLDVIFNTNNNNKTHRSRLFTAMDQCRTHLSHTLMESAIRNVNDL